MAKAETVSSITCENIDLRQQPARIAFVLRNVYSEDECKALIERAERNGFSQALVNIGGGRQRLMTDVRNSDRSIIDDPVLAGEILDRMKPHVPQEYRGHAVAGMNERLRFLRYDPGQKFEPHCDGRYERSRYDCKDASKIGEFSVFTVQLYLNSECTGGSTRFFHGREDDYTDVQPQTGSVLFFEQRDVWHQGTVVESGRKYVIRTEVMYKP